MRKKRERDGSRGGLGLGEHMAHFLLCIDPLRKNVVRRCLSTWPEVRQSWCESQLHCSRLSASCVSSGTLCNIS